MFFSPGKKVVTPRMAVNADSLLTSGGEVMVNLEGCGDDVASLSILFNGLKVPHAEFVKTNQGLRLKVTIGPGIGSGTLGAVSVCLSLLLE